MRVVDRKTFLTLPEGTFFCRGVQWSFDGLCIKGESLPNDWFYLDPAWPSAHDTGEAIQILEISIRDGISFACEDAETRDGRFNNDDIFLVFEAADLLTLRDQIDRALQVANGQSAQESRE